MCAGEAARNPTARSERTATMDARALSHHHTQSVRAPGERRAWCSSRRAESCSAAGRYIWPRIAPVATRFGPLAPRRARAARGEILSVLALDRDVV